MDPEEDEMAELAIIVEAPAPAPERRGISPQRKKSIFQSQRIIIEVRMNAA